MKRFLKIILAVVLVTFTVFQQATAENRPLVIDKANTSVVVFGESTLHDFTSKVTSFDLKVLIDEETGNIEGARFVFNFADMDSDSAKRDKAMLKWLSHSSFPVGTFSSTRIVQEKNQWFAEGTLTIHGVKKKLRFPFDLKNEAGKITIDASPVIDYQNWDLEIIKVMGFLKVSPELEIALHVEGK